MPIIHKNICRAPVAVRRYAQPQHSIAHNEKTGHHRKVMLQGGMGEWHTYIKTIRGRGYYYKQRCGPHSGSTPETVYVGPVERKRRSRGKIDWQYTLKGDGWDPTWEKAEVACMEREEGEERDRAFNQEAFLEQTASPELSAEHETSANGEKDSESGESTEGEAE